MNLEEKIRSILNYPKDGIDFKDITPLLQDGEAFRECITQMADMINSNDIDFVIGTEARGFILGAPIAIELGKGFIPVRKPGKLPSEKISCEYELEYGTDSLEMHTDAIKPGDRVLIVDDLLATGGTALATSKLVETLGGKVVSMIFLMELSFLNGRKLVEYYDVKSLIKC